MEEAEYCDCIALIYKGRIITMGYASTVAMIYSSDITAKRMQLSGRASLLPPVKMVSRSWYNPDLRSQNVIIPGIIAIVMVMIAAMLTSVTIAREWETGTMEQLISTPLKGPELIIGKVIPYFVIGMTDVAIAVAMGKWLFNVPIVGNAGLLFAMVAIFLTGALFWGMSLSIILKSQMLANQIAIVSGYLPTLILSGFVFAIENMPDLVQYATCLNPMRWYLEILREIVMKGVGLFQFIGYYRLSGYFLPFQVPGDSQHTFLPTTTFDHILQTYIFDRKLRLLVMDEVERIEVAVRTTISEIMSHQHGPHWFMEKTLFTDRFDHKGLLVKIRNESGFDRPGKRSLFCKHYYKAYDTPTLPPSWMITEILSAGTWSLIFKNIRSRQEKKAISDLYGIHQTLMISWLEAFTDLRNTCAHHSRIWNRIFIKKPMIPKDRNLSRHFIQNNRFYAHAAVLNVFLKIIADGSTWQQRLASLINTSPHIPMEAMGFFNDWDKDPFWGIT